MAKPRARDPICALCAQPVRRGDGAAFKHGELQHLTCPKPPKRRVARRAKGAR